MEEPVMTYYGRKSIPGRLAQAEEIGTTVAADETIRVRLAKTGYGEAEFDEMRQLLGDASRLEINQQVQVGKQTAATYLLNTRTQTIRLKFVGDRKIVRHVLKRNAALSDELRLHIKTKPGREALVRQVTHFYEEVVKHDDLMVHLEAEYNLTVSLFADRLQEIGDLVEAMHIQQYQMGQARVATEMRRQAMQKLDNWMSTFIAMARVAFKGEQGHLEKLHIHVRSQR